ncbi:hypothetical protein [Acidimangrovimonas sediminis]|uniref:hypothetical protein n=1 Tax=Acidimangrovimonas sediminis TaxID=2056283 RepID=UPI000C80EC1C|nr:hypothetical protein [Acidimangrovimonas sediminis]
MSLVEELADALSDDTMKAMLENGDDRFYEKVAKVIGISSPTLEEAYLTSIRIRLAEQRARRFLESERAKATRPPTAS